MSVPLPPRQSGLRPTLAILALAFVLSACGRIGPLEPPAGAAAPATPTAANPDAVLSPQAKPKIPPITAPKEPFFLDFLLK